MPFSCLPAAVARVVTHQPKQSMTTAAIIFLSVFLMHVCDTTAACLANGAPCRLSGDMSTWNRVPGFANKTRLWDRAMLDKAISFLGSPYHAKKFFDKLNSGKKIVTVAYGSSFVHDFAGCWQTSLQALWDLHIIPNPMLYPQQGADVPLERWDYVWQKCSSGGYMEGVMETLNDTWPNYGHILVNNGKGGGCLDHLVEGGCLSAYAPEEIDFVLLDTVTNVCSAAGSEKLLRSVLRGKGQPLVFLVSNSRNCMFGNSVKDPELHVKCAVKCLAEKEGNHSAPECQEPLFQDLFPAQGFEEWESVIAPYQTLAKHYNVTHFNLHTVFREMLTDDLAKSQGLTKFELLGKFYKDWVHFRKSQLGTLFFADVMVNWLVREQERLDSYSQQQKDALSYTLPPKPVFQEASTMYSSRCYGMPMSSVIKHESQKNAAGAQMLGNVIPGDFFGGFAGKAASWQAQSLPELKIVERQGWEMQGVYKNKQGEMKYKPGWLAVAPGAVLKIEVDSSFPGTNSSEPAEILITHLISYDGWGQAEVSCVSGCTCNATVIDAANTQSMSSLNKQTTVLVQQAPSCVLAFKTLSSTSSAGHKFKVVSVTVRILQAHH